MPYASWLFFACWLDLHAGCELHPSYLSWTIGDTSQSSRWSNEVVEIDQIVIVSFITLDA